MGMAARAIIIEGNKILVMYRDKYGSKYFTLVGGQLAEGESTKDAIVREVYEETGLQVTSARLVFLEKHGNPYNDQEIFLCSVAPHREVVIQEASEEGKMNRLGANMHQPVWVNLRAFEHIAFRTPMLHEAILKALKKGFPEQPLELVVIPPTSWVKFKRKVRKKLNNRR